MAKKRESSKKKTTRRKARFDLDAEIAALPPDAAESSPPLPVAVLVQEAKDIAKAAAAAAKKLRKLPFDHALIDTLPARADALADAESAWRAVRRRATGKASEAKRKEATELRTEITSAGRYLLRNDADAQRRIDDILAGDGIEDLIHDLGECAKFVRDHEDALKAADFEGGIAAAAARADELGTELAEALAAERGDATALEALAHRNRAALLVVHALDEIRAAARYAYRHAPELLRPFRSAYTELRARVRKGRQTRDQANGPAEA